MKGIRNRYSLGGNAIESTVDARRGAAPYRRALRSHSEPSCAPEAKAHCRPVEPEVRNQQYVITDSQSSRQMAVRFVEDPFEASRGVDNQSHLSPDFLPSGTAIAPRVTPQEFGAGCGIAAARPTSEIRQTIRRLLACLRLAAGNQAGAENLPMLRLGGTTMLSRLYSQTANDLFTEIADCQRGHSRPICCHCYG